LKVVLPPYQNFWLHAWDTCLSGEMLKGYVFICRNAEGVHGKKKAGNPWSNNKRSSLERRFVKNYAPLGE